MSLTEIDRHWERVINTMSEALLIISQEGRIVSVNRSFEEMTGYSSEEVSGQPCTLLACNACEMAINNQGDGWIEYLKAVAWSLQDAGHALTGEDPGRPRGTTNGTRRTVRQGVTMGSILGTEVMAFHTTGKTFTDGHACDVDLLARHEMLGRDLFADGDQVVYQFGDKLF